MFYVEIVKREGFNMAIGPCDVATFVMAAAQRIPRRQPPSVIDHRVAWAVIDRALFLGQHDFPRGMSNLPALGYKDQLTVSANDADQARIALGFDRTSEKELPFALPPLPQD